MRVPQAQIDSWEAMLHADGGGNKLVFSKDLDSAGLLQNPVGNRAIGVQYDPGNERGNYVPSLIPKRYDAYVFIDHSTALQPLNNRVRNEPPDTYPSGY